MHGSDRMSPNRLLLWGLVALALIGLLLLALAGLEALRS
jgi:hypothetical protein